MKDKTFKRFKDIKIILFIMMGILFIFTFKLMIVEGNKYREISEEKRLKDIHIPASRGNIYDRNGKLLAGSRSMFTCSFIKDELMDLDNNMRNELFKRLFYLLEEDGVNYLANTPISINEFAYNSVEDYKKENKLPNKKVVDIIIEKNLLRDILELGLKQDENSPSFTVASKAISGLQKKGKLVEFDITYDNGVHINLSDEKIKEYREKYELKSDQPLDILNELINNDVTIINTIISHPSARKLIYDYLKSSGLDDNLKLNELEFEDDRNYFLNKVELSKNFKAITMKSSALDDFSYLVENASLPILLDSIDFSEDNKVINPSQILIEMLEKKLGHDIGIVSNIDLNNEKVYIDYKDEGEKTSETAKQKLIRLCKEEKLIKDFVKDDRIKYIAQESNTKAGIIPKIDVNRWEYIFVKNKSDLLERFDLKKDVKATDLLDKMVKYYGINSSSNYEKLALVSFYKKIEESGHLGYEPINIAYGLKEKTVSKIKEQISNNRGIEISYIPVRFYPNQSLAAHTLGYLGRISQPDEIKKYIDEKNTVQMI